MIVAGVVAGSPAGRAFDGRRYVARVFPTQYAADAERYYGGFEIFALRDPAQVAVFGAKTFEFQLQRTDEVARRSGKWFVNGDRPRGLSYCETAMVASLRE